MWCWHRRFSFLNIDGKNAEYQGNDDLAHERRRFNFNQKINIIKITPRFAHDFDAGIMCL